MQVVGYHWTSFCISPVMHLHFLISKQKDFKYVRETAVIKDTKSMHRIWDGYLLSGSYTGAWWAYHVSLAFSNVMQKDFSIWSWVRDELRSVLRLEKNYLWEGFWIKAWRYITVQIQQRYLFSIRIMTTVIGSHKSKSQEWPVLTCWILSKHQEYRLQYFNNQLPKLFPVQKLYKRRG